MVFLGVTTGGSLINRLFPKWAEIMGIAPARLRGLDLPVGAAPERIRDAIREIAEDPTVRGALVTTHKIAVHQHARDLFNSFDRDAGWLGEVSAIVKSPDGLVGRALDTVTAGLALDRIVPRAHWRAHPDAQALVLGAGGAGLALAAHLVGRPPDERPATVILCDVDPRRLAGAQSALRSHDGAAVLSYCPVAGDGDADGRLAALTPHSLVVNATGLGKDRPGSPITGSARFPDRGIAWEFNYRGPRGFLEQARSREAADGLTVADGWTYFLYGWAHVIAEVFAVPLDAALFARLQCAAEAVRPGR